MSAAEGATRPAARPTVSQERWQRLAARLRLPTSGEPLATHTGGWRRIGLMMRGALFVLGLIAAVFTAGVFYLLHVPHALLCAGLALAALSEFLQRGRRLHAAGIEEALTLCGLLLVGVDSMDIFSSYGETRAAWLVAAACALAGVRLLNPLFMTAAVVVASYALHASLDPYRLPLPWTPDYVTSLCSLLVALAALAAGARLWRRPSHDRALDWLVIVMPLVAYGWVAGLRFASPEPDYRQHHSLADLYVPLVPLLFAIAAGYAGLRRRTHAPLFAAMLCVGCLAYELRHLSGWRTETRLLVWGALLLAATLLLERALRKPWRGITSQRIDDREGPLDLLQLVGASTMARHDPPPPGFDGGGGQFGGGGASGRY